ncbi:hypothetical protein [Proteiniclasticum sp.]|uniref:hypothetical protein n=1 Tax=Proteiniclasticum sp. TaxID=2053595 RepID=UPI00289FFF51|nr:hypothetical protein [Proteiniclasticum sp.]
MNSYTKFPKRQLYIILIAVAFIIFISSIDVLMRVKDSQLFEIWKAEIMKSGNFSQDFNPTFDDYAGAEMFRYLFKIAIPMGFGLLTYFTYVKLRLNRIFVFIWSVLLVGGMAYTFFELNFGSIFYYLVMAGYLVLIITVLSLNGEIGSNKNV